MGKEAMNEVRLDVEGERQLIVSLNVIDPETAKHGSRVSVLTKPGAPMPQTVELSDSVTVSMSVRWA